MSKNEMRRLMAVLALLALALAAGCGGSDDPTDPAGNNDQIPAFNGPEMYTVPSALAASTDLMAMQAESVIQTINTAAVYVSLLNSGSKALADGPPWVTTFNYMGLTIELTVDVDGDDYTYEGRLTGSLGEATYDNDLVYVAREAMDGSAGQLSYLDPATGIEVSRWSWSGSSSSLTTFDAGVVASQMVLTPDGAGGASLDIYAEGDSGTGWLSTAMVWNAAGVGTWTLYDDQGAETATGTLPSSSS
ncbi:MAG TPA: hypothetical protein PLH84_11490 [Candidatus Krumholzibacteria bacterium]|nr:hypothetical protein [Candidatus Krumholzibacteria bacterium]